MQLLTLRKKSTRLGYVVTDDLLAPEGEHADVKVPREAVGHRPVLCEAYSYCEEIEDDARRLLGPSEVLSLAARGRLVLLGGRGPVAALAAGRVVAGC